MENTRAEVPWVNESATPGERLHPRVFRYVCSSPPQGWMLTWRADTSLDMHTDLHVIKLRSQGTFVVGFCEIVAWEVEQLLIPGIFKNDYHV